MSATTDHHDTIIIGAGFAGLVAARELTQRGHDVVVLEGRDRLGGRTWYGEPLPGRPFEMGGTWVHWFQPHVWAEITRYGLGLVESPGAAAPERVMYITEGRRVDRPYSEIWPIIEDAMQRFCHDARDVLEQPYSPLLHRDRLAAIDGLNVQDRIDEIEVTQEQRDLLSGFWGLCCHAKCTEGGLVAMLRWYALSGWDVGMMFDMISRYKFANGTSSLYDRIAAEAGDIHLESPVSAIEQDDAGVTVTLEGGSTLQGDAVVVTVPLNTLGDIEFTPGLSAAKQQAAAVGQASHGSKVFVQVRGDLPEPLFAVAPDDRLLNYMQTEVVLDDGQILVGFGYDASVLDVTDLNAVAGPVRDLLGDVEIVAVGGHDWLDDRFSRGTWPVLRPGQVTDGTLEALQAREGRVHFAGSETADGWNGFIDGAIESGFRVAREVSESTVHHSTASTA